MVILARRKASWRVRPAAWTRFDAKQPRWPQGTPHVGDIGPGRWMELGDIVALLKNKEVSYEDKRAVLGKLTKAQLVKVADEAGRPITKTALKAHVIDEVVAGRKKTPAKVAKKAPTKKATPAKKAKVPAEADKGDVDEPVRPDGEGPLGEVPAGRVRPDGRGPDDVLLESGGADRVPDRGSSGRPRKGDSARPAVPGPNGADEGGKADGGEGSARGDVAAGGGGRRGQRVDVPVFRPRGQADLAPDKQEKRLAANLDALATLRRIQAEDRPATAEEQAVLARWSGWGSLPNVFKEPPPAGMYADAQARLKELLSPAEYRAANRSVRNAHYTDAGYVSAIWGAMRELGFAGGEVLEPGSGAGTFMGMVPEDIALDTHVTGVELDPITADISRALYPNQDVRNESFADTKTSDGAFDAAIGNVPFANTKLVDLEYNPGRRHSMHNHFIIKSLRMTRPGGLAAFITSRYTMDSLSPSARREMAQLGDLVGAVRLPSGAHERAAGTTVVTDLLVFRRRKPDTPYGGLPFEKARKVTIDDRDASVNELFLDNPDMVLGKMAMGSGLKDAFRVRGSGDANLALREALDNIVERARAEGWTQTEGRQPPPTFAATGRARKPDGYLQVRADGTFTRLAGGMEQPYDVPSTQREELRHLLQLRDTAMALIEAEGSTSDDTDEIKKLRADLNDLYDSYVDRWGPVSRFTETRRAKKDGDADDVEEESVTRRRPPQGGFRKDPFSAVVRSLEVFDPLTGKSRKTDIFSRRTISPRAARAEADNPADALAISLDQNGEVDLDHIADLLGVSPEEARESLGTLVFDEPDTGRLIPRAEYLSGNVRKKLEQARVSAATDPDKFAANVEELERVLPPDLTPSEVRAKMGAPWIDPKYVQQFLQEILRDPDLTVRRVHSAEWEVKSERKRSRAATTEWGTREASAVDLAKAILEQKPIRVTIEGEVDQGRTDAAQAKADEMAARFEEWVWEDPARQKDLLDTYNRRFNSLVLRTYGGDEMSLPGLAREGFYGFPHRYAAVRRIINEPSVGLWHEVGAGKTSVMIIGAMEMRRLGLVNKPAIVVPNHMLEQMTREFLERYPQARVLGIGSDDLKNDPNGEKRRDIIARAATGDWDAVILTHGAFKRIPVSSETEADYLAAETDPIKRSVERRRTQVIEQVRRENPRATEDQLRTLIATALDNDKTVKELEGKVQNAEERIKENQQTRRDPGLSFEATGIDYLFVDEAQTYKNLRTESETPGLSIPGSQIAADLHMKLHYLRSNHDRVATLATATPIANSVSEAYTMLRYLRPDLLEAMHIETFDDFAQTFGEVVTRLEVAPTGGLRTHGRFAKFVNIPELLRTWLIPSDVKTADDLRDIVKTPDLVERVDENGHRTRTPEVVVVPPSQELKGFMGELVMRAKTIPYPPKPGDDNMLRITGEGRAAALDLQMVGRHTDEPTKLDIAADRIAAIYQQNADKVYTDKEGNPVGIPGALQLVFSDIGTPTKKRRSKKAPADEGSMQDQGNAGLNGFVAYEALRDKLVQRGIPRSKIRFIHEADSDQEKAELFAAARDGRVAVLIGSTAKMGVGTNVQDRAIALHHLDAPWRPADVQQREGRIVRQGNKNPEVQIIRYVTEQSFDAYIWQAITTKGTFINQIMRGRHDVREMGDIGEFALSAAEVTALGTGNRYLIDHANARAELTRLERGLRAHEADQRNISRQINNAEADIARRRQVNAAIDEALPKRVDTRGEKFKMVLNGVEYDDRPEAQDALRTLLRQVNLGEASEDSIVGQFGGFPLRAEPVERGVRISLDGVPGSEATLDKLAISKSDNISSLQRSLENMEAVRARNVALIGEGQQDIESLKSRVGKPFRDADALKAARARFESIEAKLMEELAKRGGEQVEADTPEAKAAAALARIKSRLDAGQGFQGIGELTTWLEADPDLAARIPSDAGKKWGVLSPGGQLLTMKDPQGAWRITVPRDMTTLQSLSDFRTQKDARAFAEELEKADIPWNTGRLDEWRASDGAPIGETVARIRGQHRSFDPRGKWADTAVRAEGIRRTPERLREALMKGRNRRDGLGAASFFRVDAEDREAILGILHTAADPDNNDLETATRLREFGLADGRRYDAQSFALAAASRLEEDYRRDHPQQLDWLRGMFARRFQDISFYKSDQARLEQILSDADLHGNMTGAAERLQALEAQLREKVEKQYSTYGTGRVADLAGEIAKVLADRGALMDQFAGWSDDELRSLLGQHGLATTGSRMALLLRLRSNGVTVSAPDSPAGLLADLAGARSAAIAALLVDTVTRGRYTPQQRQARDVWLRSALVRFDPNQPRNPHTGEWIDVTPGSAVIKGFTAWLKKTYGKVGKPRIATDKKGVHVTFDYKDSPVTVDLTYLDLASFALGAAGGGVGAVAKSAHVAGKVNKAVKLAKAAKAAKVAASGAGLVASVAPRSWNTISRFERVAGKDTHPGGEQLKHYWTKDPEGLAKWATRPSGRWTALYNHLKKHMAPEMAKRVAAEWFHDVFGYWPGSDVNRVASGKPPRGEKVGPG